MKTKQKIVCRLCLKICGNFKSIEENMKNVLDILLPKIDLTAVQEPVMCTNCAEILIKCFNFKTTCLCSHDNIFSFIIEGVIKLDLINMYLSKTGTSVPADQDICGFCVSPVKKSCAILLDIEEDMKLNNMIEQCLPELDLSIIRKPVICTPCHASLEKCFHFVTNCLMVEEKIKRYSETLDKNSKHQVDLSNLLEFTIRDVATSEVDDNLVDVIKVEKPICEGSENADEKEIAIRGDRFKLEQILYDDSENVEEDVKYKSKSYMDTDDVKFDNEEHFTLNNMLAHKEDAKLDVIKFEKIFCEENKVKKETLDEMEDQQLLLKEEIEIKTDEHDFNSYQETPASSQLIMKNMNIYDPKEHMVTDQALSEVTIENLENLNETKFNHQNTSEVTEYKHQSCSLVAKRKAYQKRHILTDRKISKKTIHSCDQCSYKAKYQSLLKRHMLIHRQLSEVTVYKCENCPFVTRHKHSLNNHNKQIHRSLETEYTVYNCDRCSFKTQYKTHIKRHMLTHQKLSEITVYTCENCSFVTKHKNNLKLHMMVHQKLSDVTVYNCESCGYVTKHKNNLKLHTKKIHRSMEIMEHNVYNCGRCSFKTKYKHSLKSHILIHQELSEVTVYTCDSCAYVTKRKSNLNSHNRRIHQSSEVTEDNTVYNCDRCSFETKYKRSLERHMFMHRDLSEAPVYTCESCSYVTKRNNNLKLHMLVHQELSEVTVYSCENCAYQTKRKSNLKRHNKQIHQSLHNCDL